VIDRAALLAALNRQTRALENDLHERASEDKTIRDRLVGEWQKAVEVRRVAATYKAWAEDLITQTAAAWILGTVFLRFCEDNGLIETPFLAGPGDRLNLAQERQTEYMRRDPSATDRDWILAGFAEMSRFPAAAGSLSAADGLVGELEISRDAASDLLAFWRRRDERGQLVHDFTDSARDTRFLGDLYENLSEPAMKAYALLQTPEFVVDAVLDHTLRPAVETGGLEGLRVCDPVCGSGTFLLGAFQRVLAWWRKAEPATDAKTLIDRSLASIHGTDKAPMAVAVARFRLLVAAMNAGGYRMLQDVPSFPIRVRAADSLVEGRDSPGQQLLGMDLGSTARLECEDDLLGAGSYDVVVGNPPYIAVRDKAEAEIYRQCYPGSVGAFPLTLPFIQRFFQLAHRGGARNGEAKAGYVGMMIASSFMKREFGRTLIEQFFPTVELTHVVDASGAYIPRHGTPTVLLFGRNRPPATEHKAVGIISERGEPDVPAVPGQGHVWSSIARRLERDSRPDEWTQVVELTPETLHSFPWNLADPATAKVLDTMRTGRPLSDRVVRVGYSASTGSDDLFTAPPASWKRAHVEPEPLVDILTGSEVRDWTAEPTKKGFLPLFPPRRAEGRASITPYPQHHKRLWPYRTALRERIRKDRFAAVSEREWYAWHNVTRTRDAHPWSITFPWVATHTHFVLLRKPAMALNSAPVIRLPETASELDIIQLTALLNSSAVCFWLKRHSNSKGRPRADQTGTGEPWAEFYEFTSARLQELPLPPDRWSADRWTIHAQRLDELAREMENATPAAVIAEHGTPSRAVLDDARARWLAARSWMVALQEELDWEVYERYGLVDEDEGLTAPVEAITPLEVGERAFEIVLARRAAEGRAETTWFSRLKAHPITEMPGHWNPTYREVIRRRMEALRESQLLQVLERPEYKHRWAVPDWDRLQESAIRDWLLDQCESPHLWFSDQDGQRRPATRTATALADLLVRRVGVGEAIDLYAPGQEPSQVLRVLLEENQVPYLTALYLRDSGLRKRADWENTWVLQRQEDAQERHVEIPVPPRYSAADFLRVGYWRYRGKYDVSNERFISYPGITRSGEPVFGWAGWDHGARALTLVDLVTDVAADEVTPREAEIPLLAGLAELLPWLRQWHGDTDPVSRTILPEVIEQLLAHRLAHHGRSLSGLRAWRPVRSKRGRPRKQP
jgi:uncharacterized protein DUF7008/Eco57I restriction-modification methylase